MVEFFNKIEFNDKKYQTNGTVRDGSYKGKIVYPMKYFVPFVTDHQSVFFMSTRFLKYKINGFRVPQFQLSYIHDKTHTSQ